jgi:hypothetical protein
LITAGINVHGCFEEHIQAVRSLNEFESNTDQEKLLQLLNSISSVSRLYYRSCDETSGGCKDIKDVPAVRPEAQPAQAKRPYHNVRNVNGSEGQEKVV